MMYLQTLMPAIDALGYTIACYMLSMIWQSILLFTGILVVLLLIRKKSANLEYLTWVVFLGVMPLLPVLANLPHHISPPQEELAILPVYTPQESYITPTPNQISSEGLSQHSSDITSTTKPETPPAGVQEKRATVKLSHYPWALALMVYMSAAILYILLVIRAYIRIHGWRHSGNVLRLPEINDILSRMNIHFPVQIIQHSQVPAPFTFGLLRPAVYLPSGIDTVLNEDELRLVLVHELVHIKRHDHLLLAVSALLRAVFFFHPLVWYGVYSLSESVEKSCDEAVVNLDHDPLEYAEVLNRVARYMHRRSPVEFAAGIAFSKKELLNRIKRILSTSPLPLQPSRLMVTITLCCVLVTVAASTILPLSRMNKDGFIEVSGYVTHEGAPVEGAEIYVQSGREYSVVKKSGKSDRNGFFTVKINKLTDTLNIIVNADGYAIASKGTYTLQHNDDEIQLKRPESLSGTVIDETGKPIFGASVCIFEIWSEMALTIDHPLFIQPGSILVDMEHNLPFLRTITNKNGQFEFHNIPPVAQVRLQVTASGLAQRYGDVLQSGTISNTIVMQQEGVISGKAIISESKKPVSDITVLLWSADRYPQSSRTTTDKKGHFSFNNLTPGTYQAGIEYRDINKLPTLVARNIDDIEIKSGLVVDNILFEMIEGITVSGTICGEQVGNPLHGFDVWAYDDKTNRELALAHTKSDEKGNYSLKIPVDYKAENAFTPLGIVIKASGEERTLKSTDSPVVSGVDFSIPGDKSMNITDQIKTYTLTVQFISNGVNIIKNVVALAMDLNEYRLFPSYFQNAVPINKTYTFSGIPSGKDILIQAEHVTSNMKGTATVAAYADTMVTVTLEPYKPVRIHGQVENTEGDTIPGAAVLVDVLYSSKISAPYVRLSTSTHGTFMIRDIPAGMSVKIVAGHPSYEPQETIVETGNETEIRLEPIVLKRK